MARYFSYDPTDGSDGFEIADTADRVRTLAQSHLNIARDFASREGWDEDTDGICWGVICEQAVFREDQEYEPDDDAPAYGDYRLEGTGPSEEALRLREQLDTARNYLCEFMRLCGDEIDMEEVQEFLESMDAEQEGAGE